MKHFHLKSQFPPSQWLSCWPIAFAISRKKYASCIELGHPILLKKCKSCTEELINRVYDPIHHKWILYRRGIIQDVVYQIRVKRKKKTEHDSLFKMKIIRYSATTILNGFTQPKICGCFLLRHYSIQRHHYSQWVYATQDMRLLSASTHTDTCKLRSFFTCNLQKDSTEILSTCVSCKIFKWLDNSYGSAVYDAY